MQESPPGNPLPFSAKSASLALTICGCHIANALRKLKFQLLCALIKKQICCNPENGHNWVLVRHACVHKLRFVRAFGSMHAAAQQAVAETLRSRCKRVHQAILFHS
eukprot:719482-Pelagomonas_calceolata.AAC.1